MLYLVTCVRVKISPLIKRLKRSYQQWFPAKNIAELKIIFNFLFHTSFLYLLIFVNFHVYFISIEFERRVLLVLNFAILKISKK